MENTFFGIEWVSEIPNPPLVVNLFAGPGCGKSTCASGIFSLLKLNGIKSELVLEFAKDLVREGRTVALEKQYYIWAKQLMRIERCINQVDIVITDSPILLSILYDNMQSPSLSKTILESFNKFNNLNILLERTKPYIKDGRYQNEKEAKDLDNKSKEMLDKFNIPYHIHSGDSKGINEIVYSILLNVFGMKSKSFIMEMVGGPS